MRYNISCFRLRKFDSNSDYKQKIFLFNYLPGSPTCALKIKGLNKFNGKHVSNKVANQHNAKEKSCQRQVNKKLKNPSGTNTVLFNEETAGFKAPYYFGFDNPNSKLNCGKVYNDLFVCKDVPTTYPNANDCLNKDLKQVCKSCKDKYLKAERFHVDVNQENGHLNYDWIYYEEASGWWEKVNTNTCI